MPDAIFKENKKRLFLMIFGVAVLALSFWLIQPAPKAEAACSVGCKQDGANCYFDVGNAVFADEVCINGSLTEKDYWTWNAACSSGSNKCQQHTCQGGANGSVCSIITNKGGSCDTPGNFTKTDGKWESSSSSCVQCSGALKIYQLANPTINYVDIPDVFSTACGADSACQGKTQGCVSGNAGFCNSSGAYKPCTLPATCSGSGASAACVAPVASVLTVSANPTTVIAKSATNITFTTNVTGVNVSISGASVTPANCTTGGASFNCTINNVTPATVGTITATASKTGSTSGTTTITVQSPGSLIVTASPSSITASTPTPVTFMVKGGGLPASGIKVTLTGGYSGNCNTGGGSCSISGISAISNITATAHDPAGTFSDGTTTVVVNIVVPPPPPPPVGGTVSSPLCESALKNPADVGKLCGTHTVTAVELAAAPSIWCCSAFSGGAGFLALDKATCQAVDSGCAAVAPPPPGPVCNNNGRQDNGETGKDCGGGGCPVCAVPPPPPSCGGPGMYRSPISYCSVQELITAATGWILGLVSSIIILILVIGGIMYVTSTGDEERLRTAKNIIFYAILGLGIILISYSLITEVKRVLNVP